MSNWIRAMIAVAALTAPAAAQNGAAPRKAAASKKAGHNKPGSVPRATDGKPDLSGVWDHPFVIDMEKMGATTPAAPRKRAAARKAQAGRFP